MYDNETKLLQFYVDGGLLWQSTMTSTLSTANVFVGGDLASDAYFRGTLYQIATFDYVLSKKKASSGLPTARVTRSTLNSKKHLPFSSLLASTACF